jgi:O-methyltransferase involved in polyketide biosynthesis
VWVSEGVVMYLSDPALRSMLRAVAALSAPGSVLIVNYHEPHSDGTTSTPVRRMLFALIGEPQLGLRTRQRMAEEVGAAGFERQSDTGTEEWLRRFVADPAVTGIGKVARLLVAVKPAVS